ncbi:autotransporter outer membrane beta-barrel domain-containing protein [Bradyrhizobium sp. AUGA SZCCT0160]|uniref:autotransporter outer membrane beta-barrel domain-containing protein n=1 Tax=Bradyrhizobium sp. AUGA SZCCT0160 TaxID=2807662 RepID=UPI00390C9103
MRSSGTTSVSLTGALAYGRQEITTDRTATVAGVVRLRAESKANAWSGRIEGGYRFVAQGFGWTPYAAGQLTTFDLPAYAEQAILGSNHPQRTWPSHRRVLCDDERGPDCAAAPPRRTTSTRTAASPLRSRHCRAHGPARGSYVLVPIIPNP